ncbi:hypothetical protein THAOC_33850 [Thalassiosira oceanica]|uniref:Cyclin N-terminal domain-containing protein n=1 Tax=Thalassiosira oceanica TaxID=159749 RepID=K0R4F2_THAOC|nr:hypothetical protein THAOC_33850 [Thalassiosira oceanica]|eukprot:EJK47425.1 hypothetical protein THAOC_33850 [Thalassiosira oceanica]
MSEVAPALINASASLAIMLEKEQSTYRRCPPSHHVPREEYKDDRRLMIAWCKRLCNECHYKEELVESAMALADKYMASPNLYSYMKAHYQLIVITCLRIAMKIDSPATAPTIQEISDLCRGSYTCEEIESEEICVLQALAWYLNPPTASQIANHVLALVQAKAGATNNWAGCVDRVHDLIEASVPDLGLSTLRPSTVAMASILVTIQDIRDPFDRQAVLRSTLIVMNKFNFDSPCEIDFIRTDLSFLANDAVREDQSEHVSPQTIYNQRTQSEVPVRSATVPSIGSTGVQGQHGFCGAISRSQSAPLSFGLVAGQAEYFCGVINPAEPNSAGDSSSSESDELSTDSSEDEDDLSSSSRGRGYSDPNYLPRQAMNVPGERRRRRRRSSMSFHSASTVTTLDSIPEHVSTDEIAEGSDAELESLGVSTLSLRSRIFDHAYRTYENKKKQTKPWRSTTPSLHRTAAGNIESKLIDEFTPAAASSDLQINSDGRPTYRGAAEVPLRSPALISGRKAV